jgi:hypothetical protein
MDLPPDVQHDADDAETVRRLADALNQRILAAAKRGLLISVEVRPDPLCYGGEPSRSGAGNRSDD